MSEASSSLDEQFVQKHTEKLAETNRLLRLAQLGVMAVRGFGSRVGAESMIVFGHFLNAKKDTKIGMAVGVVGAAFLARFVGGHFGTSGSHDVIGQAADHYVGSCGVAPAEHADVNLTAAHAPISQAPTPGASHADAIDIHNRQGEVDAFEAAGWDHEKAVAAAHDQALQTELVNSGDAYVVEGSDGPTGPAHGWAHTHHLSSEGQAAVDKWYSSSDVIAAQDGQAATAEIPVEHGSLEVKLPEGTANWDANKHVLEFTPKGASPVAIELPDGAVDASGQLSPDASKSIHEVLAAHGFEAHITNADSGAEAIGKLSEHGDSGTAHIEYHTGPNEKLLHIHKGVVAFDPSALPEDSQVNPTHVIVTAKDGDSLTFPLKRNENGVFIAQFDGPIKAGIDNGDFTVRVGEIRSGSGGMTVISEATVPAKHPVGFSDDIKHFYGKKVVIDIQPSSKGVPVTPGPGAGSSPPTSPSLPSPAPSPAGLPGNGSNGTQDTNSISDYILPVGGGAAVLGVGTALAVPKSRKAIVRGAGALQHRAGKASRYVFNKGAAGLRGVGDILLNKKNKVFENPAEAEEDRKRLLVEYYNTFGNPHGSNFDVAGAEQEFTRLTKEHDTVAESALAELLFSNYFALVHADHGKRYGDPSDVDGFNLSEAKQAFDLLGQEISKTTGIDQLKRSAAASSLRAMMIELNEAIRRS